MNSLERAPSPSALSLHRDADAATALAEFVKERGLSKRIGTSNYMMAEAWAACGTLIGTTVTTSDPEPFTDLRGKPAYRVRARIERGGLILADVTHSCSTSEARWALSEDFEISSMAQTRAVGKAYRTAFSYIAKLAGYEAITAEEAAAATRIEPDNSGTTAAGGDTTDLRIGDADAADLTAIARAAKLTRGEVRTILEGVAGVGSIDHVKQRDLDAVTQALQARANPSAPPPSGAPNVGTPEVIGPDEPPEDGEVVEPIPEAGNATPDDPDPEAEPDPTSRGDSPAPAPTRQRRARKPKGGDEPAAPPLDTPTDPYESAMYGPGAP
jgi:hypothetical protein